MRIFDPEHDWFRETVADFVRRHIRPDAERFREQGGIDRRVWLAAGEQGLLGLLIPDEYGGAGAVGDFRFNAVLGEELAAEGLAFASSIGIHTDVVASYLTELTTPEQRARWLPGFCSGELTTAIGMTEPDAGSDLAALRTRADPVDGGWLLSGSKTFITNGLSADLIVVAARTGGGARGISLFVVEDGMDGFTRGRKLSKIGQHEADTAELFFDDTLIPESNLLGDLDRGFEYMMERLPQERLSAACVNVAHARAALHATIAYVKERKAFGRAIGTFQHNRFKIAELVTALDVAECYVDQCLLRHVNGELDSIDAAKAKWWSAEVQNDVLDQCVQLFGGYGYMDEYPVARAWADARITKIWAGSNEIMKEIIGKSLGLGEVYLAGDSR